MFVPFVSTMMLIPQPAHRLPICTSSNLALKFYGIFVKNLQFLSKYPAKVLLLHFNRDGFGLQEITFNDWRRNKENSQLRYMMQLKWRILCYRVFRVFRALIIII
jgi:hypothetical protein